MTGYSLLFKPSSIHANLVILATPVRTKSSLFKPPVMGPISQTSYDLNRELLVRYLNHDQNNKPFKERTILDHLDTELIHYSDPHCNLYVV